MEEDSTEGEETFCSDVIDLKAVDLSGLDSLPSPVLRASLQRVWRELAEGGEAVAYFQNSLRHARRAEESQLPAFRDGNPINQDQLRKGVIAVPATSCGRRIDQGVVAPAMIFPVSRPDGEDLGR